jgi:hypothetical protein
MFLAASIRLSIVTLGVISIDVQTLLVTALTFKKVTTTSCCFTSTRAAPRRSCWPTSSFCSQTKPLPLLVTRKRREIVLYDTPIDRNSVDPEIIQQQNEQEEESEDILNWLPDGEKARIIQENRWKPAEANYSDNPARVKNTNQNRQNQNLNEPSTQDANLQKKTSTYTEEEEELIEVLGGKHSDAPSTKRESGFLGDCTLKEIAMDYQVPICYLADVLCGWGVPPPIDPDGLLGDMVTGEQAFAILEAIHTLDMGALYDRYANYDLVTLCNEYDINLSDAFEMAVKEGWNLPFGVRTFLRVEQEERLLEALAKDMW